MTDPTGDICGWWRRALRTEGVGAGADLLALGADWAHALAVAHEVRRAYGVEMSMGDFFAEPTADRLADLAVRRARALPPAAPVPPDGAGAGGGHVAMAGLRQSYWLGRLPAFELGGPAQRYLEIDVVDLHLPRLRAACRRLVELHDALRTVITGEGGQRVLTDVGDVRIPAPDARPPGAVRERMLARAFQPDRWPLFDIRTSRVDDRRTRLHIAVDLLVGDATSFAALGTQLDRLYRDGPAAEASGRAVPFSAWWTAPAAPGLVERSREYWRDRARTLPPAPQLPLAREPRTLERPRFVRRRLRLPADAWHAVSSRARRAGLTRSAALLAVFSEVVAAWSAGPRFTLAVTTLDRPPRETQAPVIGDFATVSLIDVEQTPHTSVTSLAAALQAQLWQALDHRHLPATEVVREFARASGQPLAAPAPVVFSSRIGPDHPPVPEASWRIGGGQPVHDAMQLPQVWLHHDVAEDAGDLVVTWDTVDALFPEGLLDDLVEAHRTLLHRLAQTPPAWTHPGGQLLPERQRRVRDEVNRTAVPLPPTLLHEVFWDQAARTPDAPAVIADTRTLTYRDLRAGATALAERLRALGARPNRLVAIVMEKGWEQPLAVLGIHNAGAGYVPIEPDLPEERLHYLLTHSEVTTAVVQRHLADSLPWPPGIRRVVVDESLLDAADSVEPRLDQRQDDIAYVIYTSGSTGLPKGVMASHRGALNTCLDVNRRFDVRATDRMLALTPLSFDLSVYDLFGLWAAGGALVMPQAGTGRAPWHWADLMERHGVTLWNTVPALMEMLVDYTAGRRQRLAEALRLVLMSGDWIPVPLPERIRALAAPGIELVSLGGATEASIWSIYHRITDIDPAWPSIPYGRPLANQSFEILDAGLRSRPDWVPGEQYVAGASVALGYWRDDEKTRRAFVRHPRTGARLYRTGDLGRYFPDGTMQFLGREDFQVKIHGYRVELGEIETTMLSHDGVAAAVVTAIGKAQGEKRLIGYVTTTADDHAVLVKSLREHLSGRLPSYMVPTHILVLDELPLTRNGKVDRTALPLPQATAGQRGGTAAVGDLEERLTAIWRDLLATDAVDVTDDYLHLGAGSLTVAQAHHRITTEVAADLSLDAMFRHRTIRALARHLSSG